MTAIGDLLPVVSPGKIAQVSAATAIGYLGALAAADNLSNVANAAAAGANLVVLPQVATEAALAAAAVAQFPAGVVRVDYASGNGAPPLTFMPETGACSANGRVNDGGSCVDEASGNSFYAVFPWYIDSAEFGDVPGSGGDDGPPIRAAWAYAQSVERPLVIAAGTHLILSTDPLGNYGGVGPYPATTIPGIYFGAAAHGVINNPTIIGYGATLQMSGTNCTALPRGYGNDCRRTETALFDNLRNPVVEGLTVQGANLGSTAYSIEIAAIAAFNIVGGRFTDLNFYNYGGVGAALAGDWLVDTKFENIYAPQVGAFAADVAFLNHVTFANWTAQPADMSGAFANQGTGFSIIYDPPNAAQNLTGVSYSSTVNVEYDHNDLSGFSTCNYISEGSDFRSKGNYYHGCTGTASPAQPGVGLMVHNNDSIASGGSHPSLVSSVGDQFSGNGNATAGGGDLYLAWNSAIPSGSLSNITIQSDGFSNYVGARAYQISAQTTHHDNLIVTGNTGLQSAGINVTQISPQTDRVFANRDVYTGAVTPALPNGPGSSNVVTNIAPYSVLVRFSMGPSGGAVCTVPRGQAALCDSANTPANTPSSFTLNPGDGVYFQTAIPAAWSWTALGG
jgi:hypothetical protein